MSTMSISTGRLATAVYGSEESEDNEGQTTDDRKKVKGCALNWLCISLAVAVAIYYIVQGSYIYYNNRNFPVTWLISLAGPVCRYHQDSSTPSSSGEPTRSKTQHSPRSCSNLCSPTGNINVKPCQARV
jgi:hypothetical protein